MIRSEGAEKIAAERQRQIDAEGYDPAHDDAHDRCELIYAAICYAKHAIADHPSNVRLGDAEWPWEDEAWKPGYPAQDLVKAGALIAAEIDRLQRVNQHVVNPRRTGPVMARRATTALNQGGTSAC